MGRHAFHHHPLLGTVVDVSVVVDGPDPGPVAEAADRAAIATIERLQRVFDVYDPGSELSRWRRGDSATAGPELSEVLGLALVWQERSAGRFNPLAGALVARWRLAEAEGAPPDPVELAELARSIRRPRYRLVDGGAVRLDDCSLLDLNALAKGWIVDRALDAAAATAGIVAATVSAGGDLAHRGPEPARVAIENPLRPYDNEPPLTVVDLAGGGVATSGRSRRGFRVGGRWYAHVIDPSTGATVDHTASISVVAADAATADALATAAGVLPPDEAVAFLDGFDDAGGLVVDRSGRQLADRTWAGLSSSRCTAAPAWRPGEPPHLPRGT